jgi:hypothetical protein
MVEDEEFFCEGGLTNYKLALEEMMRQIKKNGIT